MRLLRFLRPQTPSPAPPVGSTDPHGCRCGHESRAHEHYRRGTDCALCTCPRFRAGGAVARTTYEPRDALGEQARAA